MYPRDGKSCVNFQLKLCSTKILINCSYPNSFHNIRPERILCNSHLFGVLKIVQNKTKWLPNQSLVR